MLAVGGEADVEGPTCRQWHRKWKAKKMMIVTGWLVAQLACAATVLPFLFSSSTLLELGDDDDASEERKYKSVAGYQTSC